MKRRLPPLDYLKAFGSTARRDNEMLPASRPHVTRSAVSEEIRKFDEFLRR